MTALTEFDCGCCGRPMLLATEPGLCTVCAEGEHLSPDPVVASCPVDCRKTCCTGPPW